jgi:hypothetical protein
MRRNQGTIFLEQSVMQEQMECQTTQEKMVVDRELLSLLKT